MDDRLWKTGDIITTRDYVLKVDYVIDDNHIVEVGDWSGNDVKFVKGRTAILSGEEMIDFLLGNYPENVVNIAGPVQGGLFDKCHDDLTIVKNGRCNGNCYRSPKCEWDNEHNIPLCPNCKSYGDVVVDNQWRLWTCNQCHWHCEMSN